MEDKKHAQPKLIVISGAVGAGKSTVAAALAELLNESHILNFDEYEDFIEWPDDREQWMKDGFDPSEIKVPRLKNDVTALLKKQSIPHPATGEEVRISNYLILEEPTGRERNEIRKLVDVVVYIDLPQDMCVIRMIKRVIDMKLWDSKGTFKDEPLEKVSEQLDRVANWVDHYQKARPMYLKVSKRVKNQADMIVNGQNSVDEITAEIIKELN